MSIAFDLVSQYEALTEQYEKEVEVLVDKWLNIQSQMLKIDRETAQQSFRPYGVSHDKKSLQFIVEDPNRDYYGLHYISIPADFFEDQAPYEEALYKHLKKIEIAQKSAVKNDVKRRIKALKAELAKAEAELDKEEKGK
jgi:hypothetical protein